MCGECLWNSPFLDAAVRVCPGTQAGGMVSLSNCICLNESSCSAFKSFVQTEESAATAAIVVLGNGGETENVRNIQILFCPKCLCCGWRVQRNTWIVGYCWFLKNPCFLLRGFLEPDSLHWFYFWVTDKQLELMLEIWFLLFHPDPLGLGAKAMREGLYWRFPPL